MRHEASFSQNTDKQTEQTNPLLIRLPWQKQEDRKSMEPARGGRRKRRLNLSGRNEHNARSSKSSRDVTGPPFDFSGFAYIPPLTNAACCKKLDSFSFKHTLSLSTRDRRYCRSGRCEGLRKRRGGQPNHAGCAARLGHPSGAAAQTTARWPRRTARWARCRKRSHLPAVYHPPPSCRLPLLPPNIST